MLLLTVTIWALNFTVSKYILDSGLRPLPYSSLRYTAAAPCSSRSRLPRERSLLDRPRRPAARRSPSFCS
jgi:drug/metabolite transporter (DMT)-like permease